MKTKVTTPDAPPPAGPYSQAIVIGPQVFVAGQGPLDPATGQMAPDVAGQTRQVLTNIRAILAAAGAAMEDVVKVAAYLADMADFARFNEVYREFFTDPYPVRTTVGAQLVGILVEIDVIAVVDRPT
jgi:reactive intermediate/imine deaminase